MAKRYTAQCACGAVEFEFDTDPTFIANCHCRDCKKASGRERAGYWRRTRSLGTIKGHA
jgi:hypothetical protein